jgi:transcriptional regulator with XRE-family HTH domain
MTERGHLASTPVPAEADAMHTEEQVANTLTKDYLERVRRETNLTYTEIARRAGLSPTTLTRYMSREDEQHNLRRATLKAIEQATKVSLPAELAAAASGMAPIIEPIQEESARTVPLFALYGAPGHFDYVRNDQPSDVAPRLPGIAHNLKVFALRMPDASMAPWRRPNELLYIDPTRVAAVGDHALIEMAHPRDENHPRSVFRIRRIVARNRDGSLRLASYDTEVIETVARDKVLAVHRVLEWNEASIG